MSEILTGPKLQWCGEPRLASHALTNPDPAIPEGGSPEQGSQIRGYRLQFITAQCTGHLNCRGQTPKILRYKLEKCIEKFLAPALGKPMCLFHFEINSLYAFILMMGTGEA